MRYPILDFLRWMAVIGMVLYHTYFLLVLYYHVSFWYTINLIASIIQPLSALTFIILWGFWFALAENKYWKEVWKQYLKKVYTLGLYALIVTITTSIFIPKAAVYFWILHFFAVGFLLLTVCRYFGYLNIGTIIFIFWVSIFSNWETNSAYLFPLWWIQKTFVSVDFFPLFPYFWFLLVWYISGKIIIDNKLISKIPQKNIEATVEYIGKHSLIIYMIHIPIVLWVLYIFFNLILSKNI